MAKNTHTVSLPVQCDMGGVSEIWQALLDAADGPVSLSVEAASVERLTTPYVQLLVSAGSGLAGSGGALRLQQPSPAVEEAFATLGLSESYREMAGHE